VFRERTFALLRQQPENHKQMSTLPLHGKISVDAHARAYCFITADVKLHARQHCWFQVG